jgi:phenylalanyl-tRNA synthetase beta chain
MLISYKWLQKYFNDKLPSPEDISEGIIFHAFEVESVEEVNGDTVFDIKVLPDRAHDCLSHYGISKEIAVIFDLEIKKELKLENQKEVEIGVRTQDDSRSDLKENLVIQNESDKCYRYMGRIIKNVKVTESPKWLKDSLISIGQKSINNIVDATNYVMFDLGNPIHAFDLDKLESSKIIIRNAKIGEKLTTLDKKDVELDESILIIADEKEPLAIAGIKGGTKAEVGIDTKNLIIEVASAGEILYC